MARYMHENKSKHNGDKSSKYMQLANSIDLINTYPDKLSPTEKDNFEAAKALISAHYLIYELNMEGQAIKAFHKTFKDKLSNLGF